MQSFRVAPRDEPHGRVFQLADRPVRPVDPNQLALVRVVRAFGQRVVVGVADRAGRRQHPVFLHARGIHQAYILRAVVRMVHAPLRPTVGARPRDGLFRRLQRQLPGAHRGGDGPADNSSGVCVGDERRVRERAVRQPHVGDVGDVQPVRRAGGELAPRQAEPAARPPGGDGGDRPAAAPNAPQTEFAHDAGDLVSAGLQGIPALVEQLTPHLAVPVHAHELVPVDRRDVTRQCLAARRHAAERPRLEGAVAAGGQETAVRPGRTAPGRSARPRNGRGTRRCTRPSTPCRVEPGREKGRRRRQYLIRLAQFRDLRPEPLQLGRRLRIARGLRRDRPIGPVAPAAQGLRGHAQALRDRGQGLRLRRMVRA